MISILGKETARHGAGRALWRPGWVVGLNTILFHTGINCDDGIRDFTTTTTTTPPASVSDGEVLCPPGRPSTSVLNSCVQPLAGQHCGGIGSLRGDFMQPVFEARLPRLGYL